MKRKFNIICHYPNTEEGMKALSDNIPKIHAETVINHINRLNITDKDKIHIIDELLKLEQ